MRKPRLRPHDQGLPLTVEILGTIWILPREPREAGEAREDKPWQEQRGGEQGAPMGRSRQGLGAKGTCDEKGRVPTTIPVPVPCQAPTLKNGSCCAAGICWMTRFSPSPLLAKSLSPTGCIAGSVCSGNVC